VNADSDQEFVETLTDALVSARTAGFVSAMKTTIVIVIVTSALVIGGFALFDLLTPAYAAHARTTHREPLPALEDDYAWPAAGVAQPSEPLIPDDGHVVDGLHVFRPSRFVDPERRVCDEDQDAVEITPCP